MSKYYNYEYDKNLINTLDEDVLNKKIQEIHTGNFTSKKELINHNLALVMYIAKNYSIDFNEIEDLISIGTIGLIKAIDTFNIDKKIHFATYARKCIENEILMYFRKNKKRKNDISLYSTLTEVKSETQLEIIDTLEDPLINFIEEVEDQEIYEIIRKIVIELPKREKDIILMLFGFIDNNIMTQKQIATKLGVDQSYISKIRKNALKNIENKLKNIGIIRGVNGGIAIDTNPPKRKILL